MVVLFFNGGNSTMIEFWSENGARWQNQSFLLLNQQQRGGTTCAGNQFTNRGADVQKSEKKWQRDADRVTERSDFPYSWTAVGRRAKRSGARRGTMTEREQTGAEGLERKYFSNTIAAAAFYARARIFLIEPRIDDIQIYGLTREQREHGGRARFTLDARRHSRLAIFSREIKYREFFKSNQTPSPLNIRRFLWKIGKRHPFLFFSFLSFLLLPFSYWKQFYPMWQN